MRAVGLPAAAAVVALCLLCCYSTQQHWPLISSAPGGGLLRRGRSILQDAAATAVEKEDPVQLLKKLSAAWRNSSRTIYTRPLLHLQPNGLAATDPDVFLLSGFLDTRKLLFNGAASLRLIALMRRHLQAKLLCKYITGNSYKYSPATWTQVSPFDDHEDPYTENLVTCATSIATLETLADATALPFFVTLVTAQGQHVEWDLAWVHVDVVKPIVEAEKTARVHGSIAAPATGVAPFSAPPGLTLTKEQYHAGQGEIALCTAPIHGGDFQAAAIPEWLEFNRLLGVSTVYAYDMSAGPVTQALLDRYAALKLFEVFQYRFSWRLQNHSKDCHDPERFHDPNTSEWIDPHKLPKLPGSQPTVDGQTQKDRYCKLRLWYGGQAMIGTQCLYQTMGQYRWVGLIDFDEYLAPRLPQTPDLRSFFNLYKTDFRKISEDREPSLDNPHWKWWLRYSANWTHHQANPPDPNKFLWPSGWMFQNAYVCSQCQHQFHQLTAPQNPGPAELNVSVPPAQHLSKADFHPRATLHSLMWKNVRQDDASIIPYVCAKNYVDPMAIIRHGIHVAVETWKDTGGQLDIPTQGVVVLKSSVALSYHIRLWKPLASVQLNLLSLIVNKGHSTVRKYARGADVRLQSCTKCGFNSDIVVDFTLANIYGDLLKNATSAY